MADATVKYNAEIQARVYRAKPRPKVIPAIVWRNLPRSITHKAENLGTIASTKQGNVHITR